MSLHGPCVVAVLPYAILLTVPINPKEWLSGISKSSDFGYYTNLVHSYIRDPLSIEPARIASEQLWESFSQKVRPKFTNNVP